MKRHIILTMLMFSPGGLLRADFSYDQTSKITGGALVGLMKMAGTFSKDARRANEPITSTTAVKGNRMVHRSADTAQIIDLDRETITRVHFATRTYSVITFEQMKQSLDDMSKQMRSQNPNPNTGQELQYDVSVRKTGQTKIIAGQNANEMLLTITLKATDAQTGQQGGIDTTADMWIAPEVPGYQEVRNFHRRMAEKLNWMPGANPMLGRPDIAKAMSELNKEGTKLEGMPVSEVIRMGGGGPGPDGQGSQSTRQSPPPPSVGDAVGGAIAGRLGLGGFGRKKQQQQPQDQPPASDSGTAGGGSGSLLEMTTEVTGFSAGNADPSMFEVPGGFNRVDEEAVPRGRRQ